MAQRALLTLLIGVFVVTLTTCVVFAAEGDGGPQPQQGGDNQPQWLGRMLERWDANGDGKITKDEFQGRQAMFTRLDADADGAITKEELQAVQGRQGGAQPGAWQGRRGDPAERWKGMLERWDANNDLQLSREEFGGPEQAFNALDVNGDGTITAEEYNQAAGQQRERANPAASLIRMMDEDGDGRLSEEEWGTFFTETDANGDGFVTLDELLVQMKKAARPEQPAAEAEQDQGGAPAAP